MLNEKAKDLGLTGSHFMNATGLPEPDPSPLAPTKDQRQVAGLCHSNGSASRFAG